MRHKFDFNKLFSEGVNYQRLSDASKVSQKIRLNVARNQPIAPDKSFNYFQQRSYTSIGTKSSSSLDEYIRKV